jgi:TolB-like protein/Tfp pilus assembly protein PilF
MAVLVHLAGQPGRVASREQLLGAVWPDVIVGDNALTQVVIKLRKALGDTAREPTYIQAISKKGYRLIAPVRSLDTASPLASSDQAVPPVRPHWMGSVAVTAALALIVAALFALHRQDGVSPHPVEVQTERSAARPIVVVKPLEAVSADPQELLVARALTADLVTDLSKVSGLWVASGLEQQSQSAQGSESVRARYVLSGTVQSDGERLRLQIHLSNIEAGRQLWSQRFDRHAKDLFAVQDDLVRSVLAELPVRLSEAETLRLAQRYTRNLEAYEHFLRAQAALLVRRRGQNDIAREMYWKAIQSDATFARAYAGLAMTYALEYQLGWAADDALARALEFAKTAEQMSPQMPEAHWVLGFVQTQKRQHDEALRHLDNALQLNPSYADAYALKAGIYTYVGRPADGIPLLRTALRLNPDAGSLYFLLLGRAYYFIGDVEQARVNLDHALLRNSENLEARIYLAAAHALAGDTAAADWQVGEIRTLEPHFSVRSWLASYPMTDTEQRKRLVKSLQAIGL